MNEFERVRRNILINKGGAFDGVLFESNKVNRGFDVVKNNGAIVNIELSKISISSSYVNSGVILSTEEKYDFTSFQTIKIYANVNKQTAYSIYPVFMIILNPEEPADFHPQVGKYFSNTGNNPVSQTLTFDMNEFMGNPNVNNHYFAILASDVYSQPGSIDITKIELI